MDYVEETKIHFNQRNQNVQAKLWNEPIRIKIDLEANLQI